MLPSSRLIVGSMRPRWIVTLPSSLVRSRLKRPPCLRDKNVEVLLSQHQEVHTHPVLAALQGQAGTASPPPLPLAGLLTLGDGRLCGRQVVQVPVSPRAARRDVVVQHRV